MYYFIINPHSKSGNGYRVWKKIERILNTEEIEYHACMTEYQGHATEYAEELTRGCKDPRIIVVVGGDGTFNEVLDGLCFCGTVTLGYIPAGSGNDLARSLKLPKSAKKCLKKILHPKYHKLLDYGVLTYGDDVIRHRRFIVSAGIGLDAAVCHNLLYSKARTMFNRMHMAKLGYIAVGLKQLVLAKPAKGYILLDGAKKVEFNYIYFISAQIHSTEGGGFHFAPKADYSDGELELCIASHPSKFHMVSVLLHALLPHSTKNKGIRTYRCREALIHTDKPMAVHVDGESCLYQSDLDIQCIERKVRMIV
ncbi:MAG: diacylglycerol kinase family protein [Clostridium sp.]